MAQLCCGKNGCGTAYSSSLEGIFAKKEMNKKAIAERGWGPLNYILLDHPELKMMQQQTSRIEAAYQHLKITGILPANPSDLNTDHGMAGYLMEKLVDHKSQDRACNQTFLNNATAHADCANQKMLDALRLTAGVFVAAEHHELGSTALEKVRACTELKQQRELKAVQKREEEEDKL